MTKEFAFNIIDKKLNALDGFIERGEDVIKAMQEDLKKWNEQKRHLKKLRLDVELDKGD